MPIVDMTIPENVVRYRLAQHIACLKIEVATGMKHSRGSVLKSAQQVFNVKARTKKGALAELEQLYCDLFGVAYGSAKKSTNTEGAE